MNLRTMPNLPEETSGHSSRERRQHFRAKTVGTFELTVRVWKIPPRVSLSVRPMPSQEIRINPTELSVGGLTVTIACAPTEALPADASDRLRIELRYPDGELLLEGRMRSSAVRLDDGSIVTGIQFCKSESRLGAVVNALQRAELRLRRGIDVLPTPVASIAKA